MFYDGVPFWKSSDEARQQKLRSFGVLFQGGALWSSMTLAENIGLPLGEYTDLSPAEIRDIARLKLALVGLKGFEDYYPAEISGGMCKRAGLARALALDPEILFFDEPSAGLDPISSRNLDELILQLRDSLGATFVVVTHELASIFTIADNSVFLDPNTRTMRAQGNPRELLKNSTDPAVQEFLTRGAASAQPAAAKPPVTFLSYEQESQSHHHRTVHRHRRGAGRHRLAALQLVQALLAHAATASSTSTIAQRPERGRPGQVPRRDHRLGQAGDDPVQPGHQ